MTRDELLAVLSRSPLVASVQASPGSPLDDPETLLNLAQASAAEGVQVLRLQGVGPITLVKAALQLPIIGLIKRTYPESDVYITPTEREVRELVETGCDAIAFDGTLRPRPGSASIQELVAQIHGAGRLALADCDTVQAAKVAVAAGADLVSTTLAGYTVVSPPASGPDLPLIRELVGSVAVPVLGEGRFEEPWQVQAALRAGAAAVVIGGALNDPVKQTRRFLVAAKPFRHQVGAFDLGGTWIRFGHFSSDWRLLHSEREPLPRSPAARIAWMRDRVKRHGLTRIGVGTGGTVDPRSNRVTEAKAIIPNHEGTDFSELADEVFALNDGLATAWGHACLPQHAGKRVATLALGTGVGCGLVDRGRIAMGPNGEYPRLNDLPATERSFEELLGGASLSERPAEEDRRLAIEAFARAWDLVRAMWLPDQVVVCGGVGLAPWLHADLLEGTGANLSLSPFGGDAGLHGAAALALFTPQA